MIVKRISNNSVGADAVKLSVSKAVTLIITMVTSMLLSRFRSLEEYGTYSQLLLVTSLASTVFMLGLPNSINYFLAGAENEEDKRRFLSVFYSLSTVLCLFMGGVLVCASPLIVRYFNNPDINGFIYFLAFYPWASVISSNIENILVVYQKTSLLLIFKFLNSVCLLGAVGITQLLGLGFREYMLFFLCIYSVFAIAVYIISGRLCGGISVLFDLKLIKSILTFSVPVGLASVVGTLDVELDKLLIGRVMNTEQMAIYTNASKELPVTIIAASITAVLLPRLTVLLKRDKREDAVGLWGAATELSMIFMAIIVAGLFTFGSDVMTFLYSEKYLPGLSVFRIYSLVLLLRVTYFGIILNAKGETKKILLCSILALLLNAVLNPVFYSIMGMSGPALATFLSMLLIILLQLILTSKALGVSMGKVFPWKGIAIIIGINILFSIVFAIIKELLSIEQYITSFGESLLLGVVWAALYLLFMKKQIKRLWNRMNDAGEAMQ